MISVNSFLPRLPGFSTRTFHSFSAGGFRTTAPWLAAILVLCMPSHVAQARSYIPSECGTYVQCAPASHPETTLNGQQICVNYDKPHIKVMIVNWKNDLLDGYFWCANDEGVKRVETNFRRGDIHGLYKANYGTSAAWTHQQMYKDGKPEGLQRRQMNNDYTALAFYKDGKRHGYELHLDPQDRIHKLDDCHVAGRRSPPEACADIPFPGYEDAVQAYKTAAAKAREQERNKSVETRHANGQVYQRYRLVDGRYDGRYETFYSNGNPSVLAFYDKGLKREETWYFEEGQIKQVSRFSQKTETSRTQYYQNGKAKLEWTHAGTEGLYQKYRYKHYFSSGQLASEGATYKPGWDSPAREYPDGEVRRFQSTGELLAVEFYEKGRPAGTWKYVSNSFDVEDTYADGKLSARVVLDRQTRKKLKRYEYMPDGSLRSEESF